MALPNQHSQHLFVKHCQRCGEIFEKAHRKPHQFAGIKFCSLRCANQKTYSEAEPRFWKYTAKGVETECWEWMGAKRKRSPYGMLSVAGSVVAAHRLSWEIHNGPIPPGMHVLHSCDNPSCVNPHHLSIGTHAENMADRGAKGRANHIVGNAHHKSKLTDDDVRAIRAFARRGISGCHLAKLLAMDKSTIYDVIARNTWNHVD